MKIKKILFLGFLLLTSMGLLSSVDLKISIGVIFYCFYITEINSHFDNKNKLK